MTITAAEQATITSVEAAEQSRLASVGYNPRPVNPLYGEEQVRTKFAEKCEEHSLDFRDWHDISAYEYLASLGEPYKEKLTSILDSNDPLKMDYMRVIGRTYGHAHIAALAFPDRYQDGVRSGMRKLLADSVFAVDAHIKNGSQTEAVLPLNNGGDLGLALEADEPYRLLRVLQGAIHTIGMARLYMYGVRAAVPSENIKVASPKDYALYRFVQPDPYAAYPILPVSLYVRPFGDNIFDPHVEYGRAGEGVEASISLVVDNEVAPNKLMRVGKHGSGDDDARISIRLDREGVKAVDRLAGAKKDPTLKEGTLSLDVGSVLGRDEWTSTKIGRFLAWGNLLRTHSEGTETHLNHMTDYFDAQDGDADVFALQAARLIERLDRYSINAEQLKQSLAGRAALSGARQ